MEAVIEQKYLCGVGFKLCLLWDIVMEDDIIVYKFEAVCPLSVVLAQQLRFSSPLPLFPTGAFH